MFADTDLHLCILTPYLILKGTNQHTVYQSISCSKLQLSKLIKVFCISVIFNPKGNNLHVIGDFMSKIILKMISLNFEGLLQHSTQNFMMSPTRHATFHTMAEG